MEIREEIREDVAILSPSGKVMCNPDVASFHEAAKKLAVKGLRNVVVDLSDVEWFGSSLLGVLVASLTTLRSAGGDLRLTGSTAKVEQIMKVAGLNVVFRRFGSVDLARRSFIIDPPGRVSTVTKIGAARSLPQGGRISRAQRELPASEMPAGCGCV